MKNRRCGKTDLMLSEIGFGTAPLGNIFKEMDNDKANLVIDTAYRKGIRYFDTSSQYGHGLSEIRLGQALRKYNRDDFVVSTKVGDVLRAKHSSAPPTNNFVNKLPLYLEYDYTYDGIMRCFEDALQRLGFNRLDILYVHDLDPYIHSPDMFDKYFRDFTTSGYLALRKLRDSKAVSAIGFGVRSISTCIRALNMGDYDCFMLQGGYTLLEQFALKEFFPECKKRGITVSLAGAFCSGVLATGSKGGYFHYQKAGKDILDKIYKMETICKRHSVSLKALAVNFPLRHEVISSVVVGSQRTDYLEQNIEFYNTKIPDEVWSDLESENLIEKTISTS
jgi:D-threo-aldose 1-dehydrogenase